MIIPRLNFSKLKSHQRIATPRTGSNESGQGFVHYNGVPVTAARIEKNNVSNTTSSRSQLSKSSGNCEISKNECTTDANLYEQNVCKCAKLNTVASSSPEMSSSNIVKGADNVAQPNSCRTVDDLTLKTTTNQSTNNAENITPENASWLRRSHALMEIVGFDISMCHDVHVLQYKLIEACERNVELEKYYEVELQERINYFAHRLRALTEYQLTQDALDIPTTVAVNAKIPKAVSTDIEKENVITPRYDMAKVVHVDVSSESRNLQKINVRTPRSSNSKMSNNALNITREVEDVISSASRKNINHMYSTMRNNSSSNNNISGKNNIIINNYNNKINDINYNGHSKNDSANNNSGKEINTNTNTNNNNYVISDANELCCTDKNHHRRNSSSSTPFLTPASRSRSVHPFTLTPESVPTQVQPMTTLSNRALYATPNTVVMTRVKAVPEDTLLCNEQKEKAHNIVKSHDKSNIPHNNNYCSHQQEELQHNRRDQHYVRPEIKLGEVGAGANKASKYAQHEETKVLLDSSHIYDNMLNDVDHNNYDSTIDANSKNYKNTHKRHENKRYGQRNVGKASMRTFPRSMHAAGIINTSESMMRTEPLELSLENKAPLVTPRPRRSYSAQVSDYSRHLYDLVHDNNDCNDTFQYRNNDNQMNKHVHYLRSGNRRRLRRSQTRSRVSYSKSSSSAITTDAAAAAAGNSLKKVLMGFSLHQEDNSNVSENMQEYHQHQQEHQEEQQHFMQSQSDEQIEQKKNVISNSNNNNTSNTEIELNEYNNRPNPKQCIVEMLNTSRQGYAVINNNILSTESANTQFSEPSQNTNIEQVYREEAKKEMKHIVNNTL